MLAALLLAVLVQEPGGDLSSELPRTPAPSPEEVRAGLRVEPGFRVELAAAEPLVVDPVAAAFDAGGRLFVVEMRGYSERRDQRLGRVRLLTDRDGDRRYDASVVFAEDLAWPTAIACWDGGVFVGAAPDVLFLKDTDGDGRADERRVVLTGFGSSNVQGLLNSFRWGLDGRLHGATSSAGGAVGPPGGPTVELRGRDFALDPRTLALVPTSGGGQHGLCFDDRGRKLVCANSDHCQLIVYEDRYTARGGPVLPPPARVSIAVDGRQAEVYRRSPVEPWRTVRTRLRVRGLVPGPVEGGGRAAGYFTGATGLCVYRGDAFPAAYRGSVFVADVGSNLVHRKVLADAGVSLSADRARPGGEFLTSEHVWFRPVQLENGPDGCLWILDMAREVIEHPKSLPPRIKRHLDLDSGSDRGRIWRVVPEGGVARAPGDAAPALDHPGAWQRETAARLLLEGRGSPDADALRDLAGTAALAAVRLQALCTLEALGALDDGALLAGLRDAAPGVRERAAALCEGRVRDDGGERRAALLALADDADARVRLQAAFTLGELRGEDVDAALRSILARAPADPYVRFAVSSSLGDRALEVCPGLAGPATEVAAPEPVERPDAADVDATLARLATVTSLEGERARGRALFVERCVSCHRLDGVGEEVGAGLAGVGDRGAEGVLLAIVDPGREVDPRFAEHVVETASGLLHAGLVEAETAGTITLLRAGGQRTTIRRADVVDVSPSGLSFMPTGLLDELEPQAVADLLAFVMSPEDSP